MWQQARAAGAESSETSAAGPRLAAPAEAWAEVLADTRVIIFITSKGLNTGHSNNGCGLTWFHLYINSLLLLLMASKEDQRFLEKLSQGRVKG